MRNGFAESDHMTGRAYEVALGFDWNRECRESGIIFMLPNRVRGLDAIRISELKFLSHADQGIRCLPGIHVRKVRDRRPDTKRPIHGTVYLNDLVSVILDIVVNRLNAIRDER